MLLLMPFHLDEVSPSEGLPQVDRSQQSTLVEGLKDTSSALLHDETRLLLYVGPIL